MVPIHLIVSHLIVSLLFLREWSSLCRGFNGGSCMGYIIWVSMRSLRMEMRA